MLHLDTAHVSSADLAAIRDAAIFGQLEFLIEFLKLAGGFAGFPSTNSQMVRFSLEGYSEQTFILVKLRWRLRN